MVGLLIAVIVIAVIFRVVDRVGHRVIERRPTPDELLAERYARGEITDEEYHHRHHVLHGDDHAVR
jgi:putative membrane protein